MTQIVVGPDTGIMSLEGHVKWYDIVKGYGFVVADDGGPDILLHSNVLRAFGRTSAAEGSRISLNVQHTDRGIQAVDVLALDCPRALPVVGLADLSDTDPEVLAGLPLLPARIKWFDKGKGFGFANLFRDCDDIFVHFEVLRAAGLTELAPGEAVVLRVIDGRRGRMAAQIVPWDEATER